ncbi:putative GP46-like surface antigen [Leptomonas pyrrhocoris]|uniref:Putative GP46-like surface antigen n=1 Tax=Leptomonas pyrrhocoris TaxID=157538 RepID=A0A0M9FWM0_LEPPY|nr:putative GP46-like surface antigen [Leptomonas pyrrhocoris]XP_015655831.1 putative GP46-like surface antigen [Leptomonas pyrrhocoris]XP_015655833.1 putative GP46-like surface antigen [Leptomonas pyrrhocoris]XP_015655835.1 putative GP46-like surface antigen [Leptomonas pyrrhocoris]XP_015655837.1 putative GP46-like surface antigen [Leptomonas pyrrhocoris]XP_015655839.1 putative GP46-like surface antigen [Leptomonas pyrrhocoris]XP_015655841.1 putative GP46-like surface antigen [Leptomonas pyr|eukprot:XP_015655829.1 putative GP46-like surface antigen [Leptomonas pyrrhocoris]
MACLKYPLRRMMVAGALLVLCVNALFVSAASTTDYTADQQKNTLAFLKGFAIAGSTLETSWTGTDFCSWPYVRCGYLASTLSFKAYSRPAFTGSLVLPELGADVNGSAVIFTEISASWFGQQVTGTLPTSWGRLRKLRTLRLNYNSLNGPLPADWSGMSALQSLYLNSNRLEGSLPGQWRLLSELKDLRLDNNSLSGALPAAWIRMSSLKDLYLNSNALSGTLPAAWVALTALWSLDLSNNQLTGSIPERWGELRVYTLELSSNRLCGCVPTKLKNGSYPPTVDPAVSAANCTTANVCEAHSSGSASAADDSEEIAMLTANEQNTLKFLRLVRAAVGGELRSLWGGVWYCGWQNVKCGSSGLASVTLNDVTLSGSVQLPELTSDIDGSLVDVTSFELHGKGASVTGALPTSWGRLTRLRTLDLSGNALNGSLPANWSAMTKLYTLNLAANALSGTLPVEWAAMPTLNELRLNNNSLAGAIPEEWNNMKSLQDIYLAGNDFCGCVPSAWKPGYPPYVRADDAVTSPKCRTAYRCVDGSGSSDSMAGMTEEEKSTLKFLRGFAAKTPFLASRWTGIYYCEWPYVRCGTYSNVLNFGALNSPVFTGSLELPELGADVNGSAVIFNEISVNEFGQNVTGKLPASWGRLTRLRMLDLSGNALTGSLPADWSGMAALQSLDLSSNRLEGSLPGQWGFLSKLRWFRLSSNALTGTLPAEWKTMSGLSTLNLSSNALSGSLPADWASVEYLRSLYLAANQFTGSIPAQWAAQWTYIIADLSRNHLCGCLPDGWSKKTYNIDITVDAAVSSSNCSDKNACDVHNTTTTTTAAPTQEQRNTLKFLQAFSTMDPSLAMRWTGSSYCDWAYVKCSADGAVQLDLSPLPLATAVSRTKVAALMKTVTSTATVRLPELAADVDGQQVAVTELSVYGKGSRVAGTLPASWGRLARLQTVRVQSNAITGTLPSAWSEMTSLRSLNVSGNALSGGVPDSWGGMTKLVSVDLKGTGLCGCLPAGWKSKTVAADAALTARDCASANACPAVSSTSAPPKKKSGRNLIPLWCVLGAVGGLLVGLAVGFGVRFYRRRQRDREVSGFQTVQEAEMEPFAKMPDSPY